MADAEGAAADPRPDGLAVAALYGLGSITFITAVYNTSTANLVFILAFTTMFSALLSWVFLKQRPHPATLAAMGVMILGVLIIVAELDRHRQPVRRRGRPVLVLHHRLGHHAQPVERQGHGLHRPDRRDLPVCGRSSGRFAGRISDRFALVDHFQRRCGDADLLLLPGHRSPLHLRTRKWRCSTCWKRSWRRSGCG